MNSCGILNNIVDTQQLRKILITEYMKLRRKGYDEIFNNVQRNTPKMSTDNYSVSFCILNFNQQVSKFQRA